MRKYGNILIVLGASFLMFGAFYFYYKKSTHASCSNNMEKINAEYSKDFTDLVELAYGKDFLSQGGSKSIDVMFADIPMQGKVLDIGPGLGGIDFYLAGKYSVDIIGIDCVQRLVDDANKRVAEHTLVGSVRFMHQDCDNKKYPFDSNTFDIVFAKESLLHVSDKKPLLAEVFRVLKPGGHLVILDWLVPSHNLSENLKKMMKMDGMELQMAMPQEYQDYLHAAGFTNISSQLLNQDYANYTAQNIENIGAKKADILKLLDEENYVYAIESWGLQKKIFEDKDVLITLLKATKPLSR